MEKTTCEKKKKNQERLLLGYCPFLAYTGSRYSSCIVTQRLGRLAWPGRRVTIQPLYRGWGWQLCRNRGSDTVLRHDAPHDDTMRDTARKACNTARTTQPMIQSREGHDTARGKPRHGAWCATTQSAQLVAWCTRLSLDSVYCL